MSQAFDYDVIIIGSGFGGSVSALRLSEAGFNVAVLEQGREFATEDFHKSGQNLRHLLWMPPLGWRGPLAQDVFQHVGVVRGIGVGGGSLVYAAVLLEPGERFYRDPAWAHLSSDWKAELAPHYARASQMLGRAENPYSGLQDQWLAQTAERLGAAQSYGAVPQGIYFGDPTQAPHDPFFAGKGPLRQGCNRCGQCITGCPYGAKNSLPNNYLHLACSHGAQIISNARVTAIEPLEQGYRVQRSAGQPALCAKQVIISAGVLGTLELLFHCRDVAKTLPMLPAALGEHVRTNSEAIVSILSNQTETDVTHGTTISSHFHADAQTHITQNRFPASYDFMRFYMGPLVDGERPLQRAIKVLGQLIRHPFASTRAWRTRHWHKRVSVLTVMQQADNQLRFTYGRSLLRAGRLGLKSTVSVGSRAPSYLPQANEAARAFAEVSHGQAMNVLAESVGNLSVTAHPLGGAVMADSPHEGVIDLDHQVFGYPGLYVVDASAIPANVGVNPSLTITALAERFAERFVQTHCQLHNREVSNA